MESGSTLEEALGWIPLSATYVGFTDWAAIKRDAGMESLTSASPADERLRFLLGTSMEHATAGGFAVEYLADHGQNWGWDTTDLRWEVALGTDGPPIYVLALDDHVDIGTIHRRFDEGEFERESLGSAELRSSELRPGASYVGTSGLAITNTAILESERLLILSTAREGVEELVALLEDRGGSLLGVEAATEATRSLASPAAAFLFLGPDACEGFFPLSLDPAETQDARDQLEAAGPLAHYEALAVGYQRDGDRASGKIAMSFPNAADAESDLEPRATLAREGTSLRTGGPYAQLFTLDDARVEERTVILEVTPADDRPSRLFQMAQARDMLFAAC